MRPDWGLDWHERWDQHRYFLPETFRAADKPPCLVWGYAAAGHRSPLWYLWPTATAVLLWHRKGARAEVCPLESCQTIQVGPNLLSPAAAVDCFGLWQAGGAPPAAEPAADEPCEEDDPGTSDPSEVLLARVLQGMDFKLPTGWRRQQVPLLSTASPTVWHSRFCPGNGHLPPWSSMSVSIR